MKIIQYFAKDGPPQIRYKTVTKSFMAPSAKMSLTFIGLNGEKENHIVTVTGERGTFAKDNRDLAIDLLGRYNGGSTYPSLNETIILNPVYYKLIKVEVIESFEPVEIEYETTEATV